MKQKFLFIFIIYFINITFNNFGMDRSQISEFYGPSNFDSIITKALKKPIVFQSTNADVNTANIFVHKTFKNDINNILNYIIILIKSGDDDYNKVQDINLVMTYLLFTANNKESNEPEVFLKNADFQISEDYKKIFPNLLDEICFALPNNLILKSSWQILSTMPSLYDLFCAFNFIENKELPLFFDEEIKKLSNTQGKNYLDKYLNLIATVVMTDFDRQDVLLARLVQKLGGNLGFLDYIDSLIEKIPVFKNEATKHEEKYKDLKENSKDFISNVFEYDSKIKVQNNKITLIRQEINNFKKEIINKNNKKNKNFKNLSLDENKTKN